MLRIETFSNVTGGSALFKALGHPLVAPRARALAADLASGGPVAVYDPGEGAESFAALHGFEGVEIETCFVQNAAALGRPLLGREALPVTRLLEARAPRLLVAAFDATRVADQISHLLPDGIEVLSFDTLRLPDDMITNPRYYCDPINFATNYAFLRDGDGHHTRVVSANYWSGYGARESATWCRLMDADGETLAEWRETLAPGLSAIVIDSREVRERFDLGDFAGSLFVHVVGAAGHDVVKYALDTFGDDDDVLSCTHDANAWPADLYAGVPAPGDGEKVLLWVQNSHPCPVPAGAVGVNVTGSEHIGWLDETIPPFGTRAVDVGALLPHARWPQQIEVQAGRHFVRPRYEVVADDGRRRIAHANVERTDLVADPEIPGLGPLFGKGYLLPAPILPPQRWITEVLPTPMSTAQTELPVQLVAYDQEGNEIARHRFGRLAREHAAMVDALSLVSGATADFEYGHVELIYDFDDGGEADGWLHALFRYRDRRSGHAAETSFGAHIFNTALVYRNEPQSYAGRPPGLSTRLFLRVGHPGTDTLCHLIYPASTPWRESSDTELLLHDGAGEIVASRRVHIPCSGSRLLRTSETFDAGERAAAGERGFVVVRDTTCRLFGYHGLDADGNAFCLDHMFGF